MTTYYVPTHVEIGPGSLNQLPELIGEHKKVLLVHGHRPVEDGLLEKVRVLLNQSKIAHADLGQILPNPKYRSVVRGIKKAKEEKCDLILSVGGGSSLQCAKGIAMGLCYKGKTWDFFTGKATPKEVLPVASILTNPASGDELNDSCTLIKDGKHKTIRSSLLECSFAILDPELSMLPPYPTMCESFELFIHVFERYLDATQGEKELDIQIMQSLLSSIQTLVRDNKNLDARNELFWAGVLTHSVHQQQARQFSSLAQELAYNCSLTRGTAMSALFSAWCQELKKDQNTCSRLTDLFNALFDLKEQNPESGIEKMNQLLQSMKLAQSIPEAGVLIDDQALEKIAENKEEKRILINANH